MEKAMFCFRPGYHVFDTVRIFQQVASEAILHSPQGIKQIIWHTKLRFKEHLPMILLLFSGNVLFRSFFLSDLKSIIRVETIS